MKRNSFQNVSPIMLNNLHFNKHCLKIKLKCLKIKLECLKKGLSQHITAKLQNDDYKRRHTSKKGHGLMVVFFQNASLTMLNNFYNYKHHLKVKLRCRK